MSYMDNCTACEKKARNLEFMQGQIDDIREKVEHSYKERDPDYETIIDDIMGILER